MKKVKINFMMLFSIGIVLVCLVFLTVVFLQMKDNGELKKVVDEKARELKEAQAMNKRLEKLESRRQEITYREHALNTMVPLAEEKPFSLVKELVKVGMELGLKDTEFLVKEKEKKAPDRSDSSEKAEDQAEDKETALPSGIKPIYLEMKCKATFTQLLKLLDRIHDLKRITEVEQIEVKRKAKNIPYQSATLYLKTYTFTEQ